MSDGHLRFAIYIYIYILRWTRAFHARSMDELSQVSRASHDPNCFFADPVCMFIISGGDELERDRALACDHDCDRIFDIVRSLG